jgi:hypothetical protein
MRCSGWFCYCALALICCGLGGMYRGHAEEPAGASPADAKTPDASKVSVAVARDRARLLHDVYTSTLDVMHERYFHGQRATVPARALEDVFADIARKSNVEARWIAVNTKAMSLNHEPKNEFEKRAAAELSKGKEEFELIEGGNYRRAAPIELHAECVSCHTAFFTQPPKTPRYAGLIISMPLKGE